jgi:hypothetical protein
MKYFDVEHPIQRKCCCSRFTVREDTLTVSEIYNKQQCLIFFSTCTKLHFHTCLFAESGKNIALKILHSRSS